MASIDLVPNLLPVAISELGLKATTHRFDRAESKGLPAGSAILQHPEKPLVHQFLEGGLIPGCSLTGFLKDRFCNIDCRLHVASNITRRVDGWQAFLRGSDTALVDSSASTVTCSSDPRRTLDRD